jgi:hypothetical protein
MEEHNILKQEAVLPKTGLLWEEKTLRDSKYDKRGLIGCTKTNPSIPSSPYHGDIESVDKYITVPHKFRKYFH